MDSIKDAEERRIVEDEIKEIIHKIEGTTGRKEIINKYKNIIYDEIKRRVCDVEGRIDEDLDSWANGHGNGVEGSFFIII